MQIYAYFDASCTPTNPGGCIGLGCVILHDLNKIEYFETIAKHWSNTNNVGEYLALYKLLNLLIENDLQTKSIIVRGDSNLVINQMNNLWGCKKPSLQLLLDKCRALLPSFSHIEFEWIPRELNAEADRLSHSPINPPKLVTINLQRISP